jgi:dihydrofolate reductase
MARILFNIMTTLDGFYASEDDSIDWHYADAEHERYAVELLNSVDTLLFGRKTYELMAGYWPTAPRDPIADKMNRLPKVVFSNTVTAASWSGSRVARDIATEVTAIRQSSGKDAVMFGSANLATAFAEQNLIDEYQLLICPILIGRGKSLMPQLLSHRRLALNRVHSRLSGVVELYYLRA